MNRDFEKCLQNRNIVAQEHAGELIPSELEAARGDLAWASQSFEVNNYKWSTVQAYYSMFHAARALLFAKGYREKSHFCLKTAIQALYVDEGLMDSKYISDFDTTMLLRETADYRSDYSPESAKVAIENAESFLAKTEDILATNHLLARNGQKPRP
ncbi:MAG: HEPN domain-containing protein [bacterium]|nr:HEPN domain-containing protein [bacterium]